MRRRLLLAFLVWALGVALIAEDERAAGGGDDDGGCGALARVMADECLADPRCRARRAIHGGEAARQARRGMAETLRSHGLSGGTCEAMLASVGREEALGLATDLRPSCMEAREVAECKASVYMTWVMASVVTVAAAGFAFLLVLNGARTARALARIEK